MPFTEDLADFFDPTDFATAAVWSGSATPVNGIFDKEYVEPLGVESTGPAFRCASADVPGVAHGQTLTIDGTAYAVVGVKPDVGGPGTVIIRLEVA